MFFPFKKYIKRKLASFVRNIYSSKLSAINSDIAQLKSEIAQINGVIAQLEETLKTSETHLSHDILVKTDVLEKNLHSSVHDHRTRLLNMRRAMLCNMEYKFLSARDTKKVVYTCLSGAYDELPCYEYIDSSWDYVCFTDDKDLLCHKNYGMWQIRPLVFSELDAARNNRWHKTHPHILFSDYEASLYIDSNITIRSEWIFDEIKRRDVSLLVPKHFSNDCIYAEIEFCRSLHKETESNLEKILAFLHGEKFPEHYGLNENNCIFRKHHELTVIQIMEDWWSFIRDYTKRDQLSFSYVLWTHGIRSAEIAIPNLRPRCKDFLFEAHKGPNSMIVMLPDYPVERSVFAYNIDIREVSETHSRIIGYAFKEHAECSILIGRRHLDGGETIYKADHYPRPDVQAGNNLPNDNAGFSVEADDNLSAFAIYLIDDVEKKIYCTDYVCPQI